MTITTIIALGALLGHIVFIAGVLVFAFSPQWREKLFLFGRNFGFIVGFFIALAATTLSLYYSEVVGWEPCVLCWYQRIAMYPIVVLLALAIMRRDMNARLYVFALAVIGFVIAAYQIMLQVAARTSQDSLLALCSNIGGTDCSDVYMLEFGYITFPVLAATGFLGIAVLMYLGRRRA